MSNALQAVEANRGDLVEQLVQSKAQLQARDGNGNTALHLAVRCKVELCWIDPCCCNQQLWVLFNCAAVGIGTKHTRADCGCTSEEGSLVAEGMYM